MTAILLLWDSVPDQIRSITRVELSEKCFDGTWSKKQILGNLCDSAFVNLQRLVRGQVENALQILCTKEKMVCLSPTSCRRRVDPGGGTG